MKTKLTPRQINAARKREGRPPLNFRLFRRVIAKLKATPEAYDQSDVIRKSSIAPCGTAACVGGWAYLLNGHRPKRDASKVLNVAACDLGLMAATDGGDWDKWGNDSRTVFTGYPPSKWPEPYAQQWMRAEGDTKKEAKVAIRYLTHIITTGRITE